MFTYIWRTSFVGQSISAALQNVITTLFCNIFYPYKIIAVILRLICCPIQHHSHKPVFFGGSTPESPEQVLLTHLEILSDSNLWGTQVKSRIPHWSGKTPYSSSEGFMTPLFKDETLVLPWGRSIPGVVWESAFEETCGCFWLKQELR